MGVGEEGRGEGECGSHDDEEVAFQIADLGRESRKGEGAQYDILHVQLCLYYRGALLTRMTTQW